MASKNFGILKNTYTLHTHTHTYIYIYYIFPMLLLQPHLQETTLENEEFPEATEIIHGLWVGTAEAGIEATVGVNSRQSLGKQRSKKIFPDGW